LVIHIQYKNLGAAIAPNRKERREFAIEPDLAAEPLPSKRFTLRPSYEIAVYISVMQSSRGLSCGICHVFR
jgi:hypothetical protein